MILICILCIVVMKSDGREKQTTVEHLKPLSFDRDLQECSECSTVESEIDIEAQGSELPAAGKPSPGPAGSALGEEAELSAARSAGACFLDLSDVPFPLMEYAQNLDGFCKDILSSVPLARDALPRIHAGFWRAYETIREQVLLSVRYYFCLTVKLYHTGKE